MLDATEGRRKAVRLRPVERILLLAAGAFSLVLPLVFAFVPMYSGVRTTTDGAAGRVTTTAVSATLIDVNGTWVLWYGFGPLAIALVVAFVLAVREPRRGTGALVWTLVGALALFNLAAMMTIGVFILPITGCLLAVAVVRPELDLLS